MDKLIELFKYIILAIVQGVGEILPISSSGHLVLVSKLLGIDSEGVGLELLLHLASLLALFLFYRKVLFSLIKGFFLYSFKKKKEYIKDFKYVMGMMISLVPTCLCGFFLNDYLDYFISYPIMVGVFLIFNGVNLYLVRKSENYKSVEDLRVGSFFKIGLGQCLGLIPGVSRSGSTLAMCYREKLNKEDSSKFTFLMLFPLVIGSILLNLGEFSFEGNVTLLMISFILTFLITYGSLFFLSKIINSNKLHYFAYYCFIVGIMVMVISL